MGQVWVRGPPSGEGKNQPCWNYIGWEGLLWNRKDEKFSQRMECQTDKNVKNHISLWVMFWSEHSRLTRESWEYHLHPDYHPATITGHLAQIKLPVDIAFHECTFSGNQPTHQVYFNLSTNVQHLRRCYVNNIHIYWALTLYQALPYKLYTFHVSLSSQQPGRYA